MRRMLRSSSRMKTLHLPSDRREFRSGAGRASRTVADMFDSVLTWFTPERRAHIALPVEIALGAWLAVAVLLNQQWWGGFAQGAGNGIIALALGLAVATHRVRPLIAVIALVVGGLAIVVSLAGGATPNNGLVYLAAAIVLFGTAAYGSATARWVACS